MLSHYFVPSSARFILSRDFSLSTLYPNVLFSRLEKQRNEVLLLIPPELYLHKYKISSIEFTTKYYDSRNKFYLA